GSRPVNLRKERACLMDRLHFSEQAKLQVHADAAALATLNEHRQLVTRRSHVGVTRNTQDVSRPELGAHIDDAKMIGIGRSRLDPYHRYVEKPKPCFAQSG